MKGKMLETKFVFLFISVWQVKGDCLTGKCEKISFNERQHAKQNQELVGRVFHNSVTSNPAQCYLWCINDCRCLSINYKVKNETKYCELNEGNHFTENFIFIFFFIFFYFYLFKFYLLSFYLRNYFYVKLIVYLKPEITAAEKDVKFLTYFAKQKTQNLKNNLGIGP